MRKRLIAAGIVLGAGGSYYLGSILGLLLRLPPATPSVIWPPNSLLTSALLLVPTRRWHLVLIPVLVAHLAVQLRTEWPLLLVMLLFLTNSAEAIMTAGGLRLLSDAPTSFDTPRRLSILVMVVVGATALSSFADAAAVHWLVGEPVLDGLAKPAVQQHPRAAHVRAGGGWRGHWITALDSWHVLDPGR